MVAMVCDIRKGWGKVFMETEHFYIVEWDAQPRRYEQILKDDPRIVSWYTAEELEED